MKLRTLIRVYWKNPTETGISPLPYFLKLYHRLRELLESWSNTIQYSRTRYRSRMIEFENYATGYGWLIVTSFRVFTDIKKRTGEPRGKASPVFITSTTYVTHGIVNGREYDIDMAYEFEIKIVEDIDKDTRSMLPRFLETLEELTGQIGKLDYEIFRVE